jgi:hypothetical protein
MNSPDYLRWQEHKRTQRRVWMRSLRKRGYTSPAQKLIESHLSTGQCADCGIQKPLEFIKKDEIKKLPPPSKWKEASLKLVADYISQSVLVCSNCKRLRLCNSSSSKHSS